MNAVAARAGELHRTLTRWQLALVIGLPLLSLGAGVLAGDPTKLRLVAAACLLLLLAAVGHRTPRPLLFALVVWLVALGATRRLFTSVSAVGPADPLLLVGPVGILTLTLTAYERGAFMWRSRLSQIVLALTGLIILGAFNPLQGSLVAGLSGLIFFVPLLMFWVGRTYCDDATLTRLFVLVGLLAIPAALYGLYQVFVGFPSWDARWIREVKFASLSIEGATRPFSTFSSGAEFGTFLAVAIVIWLGLTARKLLLPLAILVGALLGTAVIYQSSRGTVVMIMTAVGVMAGARRKLPLAASIALAIAFLVLVPRIVGAVAPSSFGGESSDRLLAHQVEGLSNPLDPDSSTMATHLDLLRGGIESAFTDPLGHGISAVTRAGAKFGGISAGTEADPANIAVALGILGLLAYVLLLANAYSRVYRLARTGQPLATAALGIVTVMLMQWLNGGQYSVAFLPWLIFGWADRRWRAREAGP